MVELTDIESVRQFMQKSLSDKLQDEDLEVLILQVSEAIGRYCNRELGPGGTSTRSFEFLPTRASGWWELVDCNPYEYRKVNTAKLDPDLTEVTLTAAHYRPWPYPSRDGTFFGLRLAELPTPAAVMGLEHAPALPYQTRRIDINADWGLSAVPSEVQHWANVTVDEWAKLHTGMIQAQREAEGGGPLPTDLPMNVRGGLRRWVRPTPMA